ncbi:Ornithine/acetylornithine aminotransferase [Hyella patelloides LEGE 07179]|uniref:Ornithine/acetylornithine aminotransferase n=1 Tax=Hyella patelloides LEGE 07179 TaxID=945734 RepID=A0A563VWB5_9CYAN|nr:aminotransferase class III-fold pyridoxal phosphate-dependent enzyme [Hyella patelloides]VEP15754.1 Ornithine/acetylornithine aminotransferase [Hyella patelloides LEGE 07179]
MFKYALTNTFEEILRNNIPNFYELYLNPYVTQTCFCLGEYVKSTWNQQHDYQTFLANSFEEALSGAIKLARYNSNIAKRPTRGLIFDPHYRLGAFVETKVKDEAIKFIPDLIVANNIEQLQQFVSSPNYYGFLVTLAPEEDTATKIARLIEDYDIIAIACVTRNSLATLREARTKKVKQLIPDIVIFDESFVDREVPFSAFTAQKKLYDCWNQPGKENFHSTTFQPNTVTSLHFMRCLEYADSSFFNSVAPQLELIQNDIKFRARIFGDRYNLARLKAIKLTKFLTKDVRASGNFIYSEDRQIFDCVSGVACSIRGHNPPNYVKELQTIDSKDEKTELAKRLYQYTGLECLLPVVSGASGVETALRVALTVQYPRQYAIVLKGGFGGKTLLALTGTSSASYKQNIQPLYSNVLYIDPFAKDAIAQFEAAMNQYSVAVVQIELIQGVSGVRSIPEGVLEYIQTHRQQYGYLLSIDEVQTGMYRTGFLSRSHFLGLTPDLLVLGKGTSDMMFPFGIVQYSETIRQKLNAMESQILEQIEDRHNYPIGYRTVLNLLQQAEDIQLKEQIKESGILFEKLLSEGLASCKAVRDIRVFGLLIGIELNDNYLPQRWFAKQLFSFYILDLLNHSSHPVLVGFCQAQPNVLKITPPLTIRKQEVREICSTVIETLKKPFFQLFTKALIAIVSATRNKL